MQVILLYAVISWCYGIALSSTWWSRLPDLAAATLGAMLILSYAELGIPRHSRGPALGAASVLLSPRVAMLPFTSHLAWMWLLAAAVALISAKIYFRDGPKSSSFVLLGICLGIGLAGHSDFLAVLPWALIPAVAALRGGRAIARTLPLMLIVACICWFTMRWFSIFGGLGILSGHAPETVIPVMPPGSALLIHSTNGLVSVRASAFGPADALLTAA
jgi:hypothetical protein